MTLEYQNIIVALIIVLIPAMMYLLLKLQKKRVFKEYSS